MMALVREARVRTRRGSAVKVGSSIIGVRQRAPACRRISATQGGKVAVDNAGIMICWCCIVVVVDVIVDGCRLVWLRFS